MFCKRRAIRRARRGRWYRCLLAVVSLPALLVVSTGTLAAQDSPTCAPISLAPGHWASAAAARLEAVGLAPGYFPAQRAVPLCAVVAAFREAPRVANGAFVAEPRLADLAEAWLAQLEAEFPGAIVTEPSAAPRWVGGRASLSYLRREGADSPGGGGLFPPDREGANPLDDFETAALGADLSLAAGGRFGVRLAPNIDAAGPHLGTLDAILAAGPLGIALGRNRIGYGTGSGGVVLSGAAFDRIQVETMRPVDFPAPLALLGRFTFNTFLARLHEERHPGDPYFWGMSGSLRPHDRVTLSVHRGAMFAGDDDNFPITPMNLVNMFIGRVAGGGFEDQIVSVEGRFRLPTESVLPLTAFLEWGAEDAAGAWWAVPGRVMGLHVPALPGLPQLSAGIERASFAPSCCWNPEWYRHWSFPGAWVSHDEPLGHPLGGHGVEWLGFGRLDDPHPGITLEVRGLHRRREMENLYVPGREGTSVGLDLAATWRFRPAAQIFGRLALENGDGWRERTLSAGTLIFFRP